MTLTRNGVLTGESILHLPWYRQERYEAVRRRGHDLDLQDLLKMVILPISGHTKSITSVRRNTG